MAGMRHEHRHRFPLRHSNHLTSLPLARLGGDLLRGLLRRLSVPFIAAFATPSGLPAAYQGRGGGG